MADQQLKDSGIDAVLRDLDDDDPQVRRQGVVSVVRLGDRAVRLIPRLQQLAADDPSTEVRFIAKKALNAFSQLSSPSQQSKSGRKSAGATKLFALEPIDALKVKLASPDVNIRASALRAAALKQDRSVIPTLVARSTPDQEIDPDLRALACQVIGILAGAQQLEAIGRFLKDPNPGVRGTAVDVLSQLKAMPAYLYVCQALRDPDANVVAAAAASLKALGQVNIARLASAMMRSAAHRSAAIYMLDRAKIVEGGPILVAAMADPSADIAIAATAALRKMADAGVQAAKDAVGSIVQPDAAPAPTTPPAETAPLELDDIANPNDRHARRRASRAIVDLEAVEESYLPVLLERLKVETDTPSIANLLIAASRINNRQVLPAVKEFIPHGNPGVRAAVATALGNIGSDDALNAGMPLLSDEHPDVVPRAILALKNHPYIDVGKVLEALAAKPDPKFRCAAVFTLSLLGERKHRPMLDKLAQDSDASVSEAARDAIGLVDYCTIVNPYERSGSARATGKHKATTNEPSGDAARIADLQRQLESPLPADRDAALSALSDYVHIEDVRNIFKDRSETDKDPDVRFHARKMYTAAGALFFAAPSQQVVEYAQASRAAGKCDRERLTALLADESPATRLQALSATMSMEVQGLADLLIPRLSTENESWVLAAIITAIGKFGDKAHMAALIPFFKHASPRVVANTVSAAYALSPEGASTAALALLGHEDNRVLANVLVILQDKDPQRCIGHLRLMARSKKEAHRSSAIYCFKQMKNEDLSEIFLDMYLEEEIPALAQQEADLLVNHGNAEVIDSLIQFAAKRPNRFELTKQTLDKIAEKLGWPLKTIEERLLKVQSSLSSIANPRSYPQVPALDAPPTSSSASKITSAFNAAALIAGELLVDGAAQSEEAKTPPKSKVTGQLRIGKDGLPEVFDPTTRPKANWKPMAALAAIFAGIVGMIGMAVYVLVAEPNHDRVASVPVKQSTPAPSPTRRKASPARPVPAASRIAPKGIPEWISGTVASQDGNSVLIKDHYIYYRFEFSTPVGAETVSVGQKIRVQGRNQGWDELIGAVRMDGITVGPAGGDSSRSGL